MAEEFKGFPSVIDALNKNNADAAKREEEYLPIYQRQNELLEKVVEMYDKNEHLSL